MTTTSIGKILDSYLSQLEGRPGFWHGVRDEIEIYVLSDESHDRMRIMAPIGEVREMQPDLLQVLLQANYDRALDARYALRGKELWSVTVHPLATLAPDDFASFLDQVVKLVKNTGSTFASSDLVFGGGTIHDGEDGAEDGENGDGLDSDEEDDDDSELDGDAEDDDLDDAPPRPNPPRLA
ncbi:MAG: type III secretion system chaperone [Candidatus Eisenbacteria bacterium]|uniref:Type III secretion system chaperone n=1 Tax=Eiseniibacteriota bacterium TaxID=2212470 RepID=A0A849SPK0_UNCEI|nr:type III secretion system chaperone [Candidatus Eisenbacteria bacterium]